MFNNKVQPVKNFMAILTGPDTVKEDLLSPLKMNWGPIDYVSRKYPFDITDYYKNEMGENLNRFFISFENLIQPDEIKIIKKMTNAIESCFAVNGQRKINLDPGYMDYQKIVLASLKFGGQKIALDNEVYADLTLYYKKGSFIHFPWTFPDFKNSLYYNDLMEIRLLYKKQIKNL